MKNFIEGLQMKVELTRLQKDFKIQQRIYRVFEKEAQQEGEEKQHIQMRAEQINELFHHFDEVINTLMTYTEFTTKKMVESPVNPKDKKVLQLYVTEMEHMYQEAIAKQTQTSEDFSKKEMNREISHIVSRMVEGTTIIQNFDYYISILREYTKNHQNQKEGL